MSEQTTGQAILQAVDVMHSNTCDEYRASVVKMGFDEFLEASKKMPCPHCLMVENERLKKDVSEVLDMLKRLKQWCPSGFLWHGAAEEIEILAEKEDGI